MNTTTTLLHIASRGRLLSSTSSSLAQTGVRIPKCSHSRFLSSLPSSAAQEQDEEWDVPTAQLKSLPKPPLLSLQKAVAAPRDKKGDENNDEEESHVLPHKSPSELVFTGNHRMPITSTLHIVTPQEDTPRGTWPIFRLMDEDGHFRDPAMDGYAPRTNETTTARRIHRNSNNNNNTPSSTAAAVVAPQHHSLDSLRTHLQTRYPQFHDEFQRCSLLRDSEYDYPDTLSRNTLLRAHVHMTRLREMDMILQNAQRQGRISFYMTCRGEEAIHIGSASALDRRDVILAQYREAGVLMWRGFTLQQFTSQCFSNDLDLGKGRQMPVHYGSRALNYHTISSPLGTQLPQAVGVAYHLKQEQHDNQVAVCFFGDGCASTTDFHSACNFAATLKVPLLFICRNNGYAISTPVTEQYAGDGIVSRAPGYGMAGIRVDGNDVFAVHEAVRAAREYALANSSPVLLELMTYRQGHHSTSDDSTRYRNLQEVHAHQQAHFGDDPCKRMDAFLKQHYDDVVDEGWLITTRDEEKLAVLRAMEAAEQRPKPPLESLFEDVYKNVPLHLQRQEEQLRQHLKKYPKRYS